MLTEDDLKKLVNVTINADTLPANKAEFANILLWFAREVERETRHGIEKNIQALANSVQRKVDLRDLMERHT